MSDQITLEELLEQIERIPAERLNDIGRKVIDAIPKIIGRINRSPLDQSTITTLLADSAKKLKPIL